MAHNETLLVNGMEMNVRMFDHSAQEIDEAVGRALTGGALDTSVTNVSNQLGTFVRPNLLDNWYFGRPVNQRGKTEYTSNVYTVDRWMIGAGSSGTLSLADSGLKLERTDGIMYLTHRILKTKIPEGNVLTYSVLNTSGLFSTSFVVKNDTYHEQVVGGGISLGWNYTFAEMVEFTLVNNTVNSEVTILAAKLELGPTQTLAHKEGDKWILNEVPDYGEQLGRCQRYAVEFISPDENYSFLGSGSYMSSDGCVFVFIPTSTTLRTKPVATATGLFRLVDADNAGADVPIDNSRLHVDHYSSNGVSLACYPVAGAQLVNGKTYHLWLVNSSGSLMVSADL